MTEYSRKRGRDIQLQLEPGRYLCRGKRSSAGGGPGREKHHGGRGRDRLQLCHRQFRNELQYPPGVYGSYHPIRFVSKTPQSQDAKLPYVVAGYLCEFR